MHKVFVCQRTGGKLFLLYEAENRFDMLEKAFNERSIIVHYQNFNHWIITALNGRLQNRCSQTLKRLHQLLYEPESPRKRCSFGGRALRKTSLSKLGIRVLDVFFPLNKEVSRGSGAVFTLPLHCNADPA